MPRKPIASPDSMVDIARDRYQAAYDLMNEVINGACFLGDDPDMDELFDRAGALLDRARTSYLRACIKAGAVYRP